MEIIFFPLGTFSGTKNLGQRIVRFVLTHFMKHQLGEDPKGLADKVRFFCFLNAD
jgi:hypothetical protein